MRRGQSAGLTFFLLFALTGWPRAAQAATLGADGRLQMSPDSVVALGFESVGELTAAKLTTLTWGTKGKLFASAPAASTIASWLVTGPAQLEGEGALRLDASTNAGVMLRSPELSNLTGSRLEVTMWGRAEGAEPALVVVYGTPSDSVGPFHFARVVALATGQVTSDGWAEYSTGPIDGSVWEHPIMGLLLTTRHGTSLGTVLLTDHSLNPNQASPAELDENGSALIDAVEVRKIAGDPTPEVSCSAVDPASTCGPDGDCFFGHCVSSAVVWGPVPSSPEHRAQLGERLIFSMDHFHGDRAAAAKVAGDFTTRVKALTGEPSPHPSAFYGGLFEAVLSLRDGHTKLGRPPSNYSLFTPIADDYSSTMDICFGLVDDDVSTTPGLGYAIYANIGNGSVTEELKAGDRLITVDEMPVDAWLDAVWLRSTYGVPNDPAADPSMRAQLLASLIGRRARTLGFVRCQAGGDCAALPPIEVGEQLHEQIVKTGGWDGANEACRLRFHDAVAKPPLAGSSNVASEVGADGITAVEFDGFSPADGATWEQELSAAFAQSPAQAIVDARLGDGGQYYLGRFMVDLLRGAGDPTASFAAPRGGDTDIDATWLFGGLTKGCFDPANADSWVCGWLGNQIYKTGAKVPSGAATKIAWLDSNDISMNDIVPRLLKGRKNFRLFAPHASSGAYGMVSKLPPIVASWEPGSLQVLDTRFGAGAVAATQSSWESGQGITPDEIVVQKLSDLLAGHDTMLDRAHEWLKTP